jgi:hypothetical protein
MMNSRIVATAQRTARGRVLEVNYPPEMDRRRGWREVVYRNSSAATRLWRLARPRFPAADERVFQKVGTTILVKPLKLNWLRGRR